jgi:hypothetical protein
MIQFLSLLKNPFVKIIAEKTVGAIKHKLEKDKIIKAKEIEATNKLDVAKVGVQLEQVKQQEHSWKDEWITIIFTLLFVGHFVPDFQPHFDRAWEILSSANDYFWIIILTIVGGSFGSRLIPKKK